MEDGRKPRILVVGAGAVGAFYGAVLARSGAEVSVVCRSDLESVRENGFRIDSHLGDFSFRPAAVLASAEDYEGIPDYLLLTVKVLDELDRAALIAPAVGESTTILLIQNGIEIEREIADAFPDNTILSAVAFIAASRVSAGHLHHKAYGRLDMGKYPEGIGDEARRLAGLFESGGVQCNLTSDLGTARWHKCVWNAAFNPASVLCDAATTTNLLSGEEAEGFIRAIMQEICDVARAAGHPLEDDIIDDYIENTRCMPAYQNSMALDYLHGRAMETEAILGNAVRAGRREGVAIPRLETVYALMQILKDRLREQQEADT